MAKTDRKPMLDELDVITEGCPYCKVRIPEFEKEIAALKKNGTDFSLAKVKEFEPALNLMKSSKALRNRGGKYQCDGCGKMWEKEAIGKAYTPELELGAATNKELKLKAMQGI